MLHSQTVNTISFELSFAADTLLNDLNARISTENTEIFKTQIISAKLNNV